MRINKTILIIFLLLFFVGCISNKNTIKTGSQSAVALTENQQNAWHYFMKGLWDEFEYRYEDALLNYYMASSFDSTNAAIYMAIAENEIRLEIYDVALIFINKSLRLNPSNKIALRKKGEVLSKLNRYTESYQIFKTLLKMEPDDSYIQYLTKNLIKLIDNKEEETWFYEFLASKLEDDNFKIQLANYYFINDQVASAQEIYENILSRDSTNIAAAKPLVDCYIYRGWDEKAAALLLHILKKERDNHLVVKLLDVYNKLNRDEESIVFLKNYLSDFSDEPHLVLVLSDFYIQSGRYIESLNTLHKYEELFSEQLSPLYFEIKARAYLGQFNQDSTNISYLDSARVILNKSLEFHVKDENLWMLLVFTLTRDNNFTGALEILQKAEPLFPQSSGLLTLHAQILFQLQKENEVLPILKRLIAIEPTSRIAISFLANHYMNIQDYTQSDSLYLNGLIYYPDEALFLNNLAYSYAQRNVHLNKALEMIEKALRIEPENPAYLDTKGWILYKLGNYKQAFALIFKAYQMNTKDAEVLEHLGDVLMKLDKIETAKIYLKRALELNPDNKNLQIKLEKLK